MAYSFIQEKEGLMTELRKELRVSDDEHRMVLSRVNADDMIHQIRSDHVVPCIFLKMVDLL